MKQCKQHTNYPLAFPLEFIKMFHQTSFEGFFQDISSESVSSKLYLTECPLYICVRDWYKGNMTCCNEKVTEIGSLGSPPFPYMAYLLNTVTPPIFLSVLIRVFRSLLCKILVILLSTLNIGPV